MNGPSPTPDPGPGPAHSGNLRLTPTEDLILDLVAARRRLGYNICQIPTVHRKALARLAELGLIGHDSGNVERHRKVWLTEDGMVYAMDPTLVPPALGPACRSFYLGPQTGDRRVDCERRNHHKGKHCSGWYSRTTTPSGEVIVAPCKVKWSDDEAGGLVSDVYGQELREWVVERDAKIAAARVRFGKSEPDPASNPQF